MAAGGWYEGRSGRLSGHVIAVIPVTWTGVLLHVKFQNMAAVRD